MTELSRETIIRAWRDEEYLETLSDDERAALPESPVGRAKLNATRDFSADADTTYQGQCGTFIANTCDTFIAGCCSTFIANTCDTFIASCCGSGGG